MNQDTATFHNVRPSAQQPLRWLVTGGCGFIGRNLIKELMLEGGHGIRVLDNLKVGTRDDLSQVCGFVESDPSSLLTSHSSQSVELVVGTITDPDVCSKVTAGMDVIVHLAANTGVGPSVDDPKADMDSNVIGTVNMLEAARSHRVKRFVFASSGAPAGETEPPIHEELPPHPVSPYGASKLAGEGYCSAYFRTFGLETVCLRFGNVYGPLSGKKDSVVAKFIKQVLAGESVEIYGDGSQTRDFIHSTDLVRAIRLAASTPGIGGETFQVATSQEHTVNEVAELIKTELKEQCGLEMDITHGQPRLGDVKRNYSDTSKARSVLGWNSTIDVGPGIKNLVGWFVDESRG